jgi:hypothetical protein
MSNFIVRRKIFSRAKIDIRTRTCVILLHCGRVDTGKFRVNQGYLYCTSKLQRSSETDTSPPSRELNPGPPALQANTLCKEHSNGVINSYSEPRDVLLQKPNNIKRVWWPNAFFYLFGTFKLCSSLVLRRIVACRKGTGSRGGIRIY